jgi:hypothetical protein
MALTPLYYAMLSRKTRQAIAKRYSLKEIENEPEFNELRRDRIYQTMAARFAASH